MSRYNISCEDKSWHVSGTTPITIEDRETGEIYKFTKATLTRNHPLEYNQELCEELFALDDLFYKWFPIRFRTDEMTRHLIAKYYIRENSTWLYEYYLIDLRDKAMSLEYARHKNTSLLYVPEEQIDQSMCDMFIKANPDCLREIPREFMRDEYIDIVLKNQYNLYFVPREYRTAEVCLKFINKYRKMNSQRYKVSLQYVPDELIPQICTRTGIKYSETLNTDENDRFMQNRIEPRNVRALIKRD